MQSEGGSDIIIKKVSDILPVCDKDISLGASFQLSEEITLSGLFNLILPSTQAHVRYLQAMPMSMERGGAPRMSPSAVESVCFVWIH